MFAAYPELQPMGLAGAVISGAIVHVPGDASVAPGNQAPHNSIETPLAWPELHLLVVNY